MEIRLLYGNELQQAVFAAHEVFEAGVRPYIRTQQEADYFYQYVRTENLWQEMSRKSLFLWGAFENAFLCAVGAIRDSGQITMLYVRPHYVRRHIGLQLVNAMSTYVANVSGQERVTINVTPVSAASYFYHIGFTLIQGSAPAATYIPLERRIWSVPQYPFVWSAAGQPGIPGAGYAPGMGAAGAGYGPGMGAAGAGYGPGAGTPVQAGFGGPSGGGGSYGVSRGGFPPAGGVPAAGGYGSQPGFTGQPGAPAGPAYGPQYRYKMYQNPLPAKPEVTYPVKKVPVKWIVSLAAGALVICFSVMTGVTVHHISADGLWTEDGLSVDATEEDEIFKELGNGEEI